MIKLVDILNDFCSPPKPARRGSATSMERTMYVNGGWRAEFKCILGHWNMLAARYPSEREAVVAASIHGAVFRNKQRKDIEAATSCRRKKLPISGALTDC